MRIFFLLSWFLLAIAGSAQGLLKGQVVDAEKGSPIPKASVFLNNTSIGTTANDEGRFEFYIPDGKYELIVSSIGYNTGNLPINAAHLQNLTIKLTVRAPELETIVIEPYEKDGWQKWGSFFLENFIGTSSMASDCRILNKEVIRFRHSKKKKHLSAHASEPLLIENKALGYHIRYQLETFQFDFNTQCVLYMGYPFFEPLNGKEKKIRSWESKRREVYYGSVMHFMRSLYRNTLLQQGFEVRRMQKPLNTEKQRVKELLRLQAQDALFTGTTIQVGSVGTSDSSDYYNEVLDQPDTKTIIQKNVLSGDSIAFAVDSVTAGFQFDDYLHVHYTKGKAPAEYKRLYPRSGTALFSELHVQDAATIIVQANGMYHNPADLVIAGYWGWHEKIATMLPFDYKPDE